MIFCAVAGPTPGSASSSASDAVLRSSFPLALAVEFLARPPRPVVSPCAAAPAVVVPAGVAVVPAGEEFSEVCGEVVLVLLVPVVSELFLWRLWVVVEVVDELLSGVSLSLVAS